jgi:uracil-DNA glycosylase
MIQGKIKDSEIQRFVDSLASVEVSAETCNQYSFGDSFNEIRRRNLLLYLKRIAEADPQIVLVGEAPGYQGSRLTGVPFTSEHILLEGIPTLSMFGPNSGYQKTDEFSKVHKEPTATIVWKTLGNLNFLPLLWASFPFHPFKDGDPRSNRAPTKGEVEIGKDILLDLTDIFRIEEFVAVGNVADTLLTKLNIPHQKVRHPSHGGATEFAKGLERLRLQK